MGNGTELPCHVYAGRGSPPRDDGLAQAGTDCISIGRNCSGAIQL